VARRARRWALATAALALVVATGLDAWALTVSVRELVETPDRFDGRAVTVHGTVASLHRQVSRRGNPYYTFSLSDGLRVVRVFSFGDTACRNGESASMDGKFSRVKTFGGYTFYNEVTGTRILCNSR